MPNNFVIFLEVPPSDNELYTNNKLRNGKPGRFKTTEAKAWQVKANWHLRQKEWPINLPKKTLWELEGLLYVPKGKHFVWDLSNRWKLLIDTVAKFIGSDDRYLVKFGPFEKILSKKENGQVLLRLKVLD